MLKDISNNGNFFSGKKIKERESDRTIIYSISQCRRQIYLRMLLCQVNMNIKFRIIIIWDENLMTHTYNILAVSRMQKDITNNGNFFSGKTVIFCGDPRQTLPVIPKASRSVIVSASLIKCPLIWNSAMIWTSILDYAMERQ